MIISGLAVAVADYKTGRVMLVTGGDGGIRTLDTGITRITV